MFVHAYVYHSLPRCPAAKQPVSQPHDRMARSSLTSSSIGCLHLRSREGANRLVYVYTYVCICVCVPAVGPNER